MTLCESSGGRASSAVAAAAAGCWGNVAFESVVGAVSATRAIEVASASRCASADGVDVLGVVILIAESCGEGAAAVAAAGGSADVVN